LIARKPQVWMMQGDTIEIEIDGVGVPSKSTRGNRPVV